MGRSPPVGPRPRPAHYVEYYALRCAELLLRLLPEAVGSALGGGLGWFTCSVLRVRRGVVDGNLVRAFPERSPSGRRRIARGAYVHLGREAVALARLQSLGPESVKERTEIRGWEPFRSALEEGGGAIVLTGHLGNWEIGGAALAARRVPLDVVAVRQANPLFDGRIVSAREALGMRVIEKKRAPVGVLRALRQGRAVALVADQNVRRGGIFVDFFGHPASTARGPALFAFRTRAPIFLGVALRQPGAKARYQVTLRPLPGPEGGDQEEEVRRLTRSYLRALEEEIRAAPAQYFWHHRRWKTRPEPDGAGT